jgi:hypothetical protein
VAETLSEKEGKFMETFNAEIKREEQKTVLVLKGRSINHEIVLTEDNPNNVKTVFNDLLKELKDGEFEFNLIDSKPDLFQQISKEYITQLNSELLSVYQELKDYELLNE